MPSSITRFQPEIPLTVPPEVVTNGFWLSDQARRLPTHVMADSGTGKSRFGGRLLCLCDFLRGAPQVLLDCAGGTIQNFLDRLICLPPHYQEKLWPRIRYTELGATDYVTPLPFFYRLQPDEPLAVTAGRYLEVIRRTDPYLASASVEGWNALYEIGIAAGILTASLDGQLTDMIDLIQQSKAWLKRHEQALPNRYGVQPALAYFKFFSELSPDRQRRLAGSLLTKVISYQVQPDLTAFVAGKRPGVTMAQVEHEHLTWLIDGRNLPAAQKQELLLWVFRFVTDYIAHRGIAGRERPIHFFIDEITSILGFSSLQNEALAEDLEQLITVQARNFGCVLTIAHQSLTQINSERIRAALMAVGTQMIGRISSPDDRLYLAKKFLQYAPLKTKQLIPQYFNMAEPEILHVGLHPQVFARPNPVVLDYINETLSIDEQVQLLADRFRDLDRFRFLVRPATGEGSFAQRLHEISIEEIDYGRYPNEDVLAETRRQLRERDGYPVAQLLAEIRERQRPSITVRQHRHRKSAAKSPKPDGILEKSGDTAHDPSDRHIPEQKKEKKEKINFWTEETPRHPSA